MDITLQDLQVIDQAFFNEISEEWNRVCALGFGNPQLRIYQNLSNEETKHVTVIIVMQKSSAIYSFFQKSGDEESYKNYIHITPNLGKWIGEHS